MTTVNTDMLRAQGRLLNNKHFPLMEGKPLIDAADEIDRLRSIVEEVSRTIYRHSNPECACAVCRAHNYIEGANEQ